MKIFRWLSENILFVSTLFLLAFIPLYPKLPLLDINHTWVYIRVEDFVVLFVLTVWAVFLFRKKITLRSPLTIPIFVFWIVGAIATIHGILLIFPTLANVFPNVAFLNYMRRIEYLSVFFVAFAAMKDKRYLSSVVAILAITLFFVAIYGIGQRYLGFPAYLTMNEEFAKGEAIQLSQLSRVPSTFAGHYDLAAYLVLILPILTSMIFGFKKWFSKLSLIVLIGLGFLLMFMTVSRVSFFVLLIALGVVLFFQKKKVVFFSLPIIALLTFLLLSFTPALLSRFGNTIKEVDVLVDATTGEAIGQAKEVPASYFKDKLIMQDYILRKNTVEGVKISPAVLATSSAISTNPTLVVPFYALPEKVILFVPANTSTGENLPQGTGYINLSLSPVTRKLGEYFYEQKKGSNNVDSADVIIINGNFLVKRAAAYDLSFTTRFQGEWPHAIQAFMRNIFLGSGYGSISLAIDNNYFRILGEVGLLGAAAFFAIFLTTGIYIRKVLPQVDSPIVKSFVLGFIAGVIGLALNAAFIDVFEASKIAFLLWLLTGVTLGTLHLYQKGQVDLYKEFRRTIMSPYVIIVFLGIFIMFVFSPMINNYFVGDDFTWFRWAAQGGNIFNYFTHADGFFYRPGTKIYFLMMYSVFWLNQAVYHIVSIGLHFIVTVLVYLLAKKVLRDNMFAVLASFLFVILSGYSESIFWISSTGYLFTAVFSLSSLLFFIQWEEKKKMMYFVGSFIFCLLGFLFHELGIITPFLVVLYKVTNDASFKPAKIFNKTYAFFCVLPLLLYGIIRFAANSHWFSGDYNYSLIKLPFNIVGNTLGYFMLTLFGSISMPFYQAIRSILREHIVVAIIAAVLVGCIVFVMCRFVKKYMGKEDKRMIFFGFGFFLIGLLPFLGLGNITSRYSYISSIGFVFVFVFLIKKIYIFLKTQGKDIAIAGVSIILALFFLLHLMQIEQIHGDWHTAGETAKRFLVAMDEVYDGYWAKEPMRLYFVNVPIKTGEAWIFPVGLEDALWFSFRNPMISINQSPSVEQALTEISGSRNEKVFEFGENGKLVEHRKKMSNL